MGKAAVLHAAAVKIFIRIRLQGQAGFTLLKKDGSGLLHHHGIVLQVDDPEQGGFLVYLNPDLARGNGDHAVLLVHVQFGNGPSGIVRQDFGFRFRLRVPDDAALVIPENPENVVPVKIKRHPLILSKQHLHGGRIDLPGAFNSLDLLFRGLSA